MPQYFGKLPTDQQAWSTIAAMQSVQLQNQQIECRCGEARLRVTVLAENLVRVRFTPTGEFLPRRSWAVALEDDEWGAVACEVRESATAVELKTAQIRVVIDRSNGRVAAFDRAGLPFAQDREPGIGWRQGAIVNWKQIESDEHFYGFGERTGWLDKLAERKTNWTVDALDYDSLTDEMYQAIPFFMALRPGLAYGLFFNTTFWSQFDLGAAQPGVWQMATQGPELDYYLIYGPEPAQILATYTQLTGRMPLPPKWAIGYHQCRWSYESETVVRELAQEFRQRRIPCDVIHLDIDYMRGYRVFTWSPKRFPNPQKLIEDLRQDGFQVVTIVDPGVKYEPEADYAVFDQGIEKDCFVRKADGQLFHGYVWPEKAVFPDFLRPEVRQWWGDWHQALTDVGVAGIWNDMNEPAIDDRPFGDEGNKIWFPLDAPQGPATERTTHREAHNLYGLKMSQAAAEALERLRPQERSFVLTRSGYAGVQRWSSVWMGDNQSLWEHLELSLPMLCNMGLSGVAFVGCDIGGFAGNATAELFARWMQVGMLYPLMRGHSAMSTARHEPWVFGDRVEQICREYIELRYRLLPYFYTLFWEAAMTGSPILRPLLYEFPNDPATYALYDQVLLGATLMAAPIYRPGVEYRAVYLPEGRWYDWWDGSVYEGPTHILVHAPLERMPLFVRSGAIIPMGPVQQSVQADPGSELILQVWPGVGEFTLYEDDGKSFNYRQGEWSLTRYRVTTEHVTTEHGATEADETNRAQTITVTIEPRQGNWVVPPRQMTIQVTGRPPQQVWDTGEGQSLTFRLP